MTQIISGKDSLKHFLENIRNTKVIDVVRELESFGVDVFVHDPIANAEDAMHEYGVSLVSWESLPEADAMVLAVAHSDFICMNLEYLLSKLQKGGCFIDIKSKFDRDALANKGIRTWRL